MKMRSGSSFGPSENTVQYLCHHGRHHILVDKKSLDGGLMCSFCRLFYCASHLSRIYKTTRGEWPLAWKCPRCCGDCKCSRCRIPHKLSEDSSTSTFTSGGYTDSREVGAAEPMVFAMEDRPLPPSDVPEENILVMVRVRPPTPKEASSDDCAAWVCINKSIFQRTKESEIYIFDRVFNETCLDRELYEVGVKDVALSAMTGINVSIIVYGQSGSGKTYTMNGITENIIGDIYAHISKTVEREFAMKFSAFQVYDENIVDLNYVGPPKAPLDVYDYVDDPENGTYVSGLTEKLVISAEHLKQMIAACVGKRKAGVSSLGKRKAGVSSLSNRNSQSHRILKLTIKSSPRDSSGGVRSLLASLTLVDLAGSENAAGTNIGGATLKQERKRKQSLLSLTRVINVLSDGNTSIHVPYRDSLLTRILKASLGGNARTAIICTLSPSSRHVNVSQDTLAFGESARKVTNLAKVNVVFPVEKKKGSRKPAAAAKPSAGAAKKRGAAAGAASKKPAAGQKLITEVLKPVTAEASPEKKVRKMRPSPFNKKSGSVLGRMSNKEDAIEEDETMGVGESSGEVAAAKARATDLCGEFF